ncbi:hypothetical protein FOXYS1_1460 [Fusarium oxysporum]|uniref:Ubiquitin 3 binding protein But2 C-terminal domain-containing protein n=1 Tax=Fusarium oxysporum TaxID=5507 RepID=A0A8H5EQI1_FUSOX|nr:hypothetical protein FOXYS1_1460 [Fusarium oxysporum]
MRFHILLSLGLGCMASPCKPSSSAVTTAATESSSTETSNPTSTIALSASMTEAMSSETFTTEASSAPTTDATTLFTTISASPGTTTSSPATTSSVAPIAYRVKAQDGPIPNAIVRYSPTSGGVLEIASTPTDDSVEAVLSIDPDTGYLSSNGHEMCTISDITNRYTTIHICYDFEVTEQTRFTCEFDAGGSLQCRAPKLSCFYTEDEDGESTTVCTNTGEFWTQLYARSIAPGKYDIGIGRANLPTATWTPVDLLLQELQS